jgi:hypothetical protein
MKTRLWMLLVVALAAVAVPGCWIVSGQFVVSVDLPDPMLIDGSTGTSPIVGSQIDLTTESAYKDHKDDLKGLADCAILGKVTNTGSTALDLVVYMTPAATSLTTPNALAAYSPKYKLWGPLKLAAGKSVTIDWDGSSGLFDKAGKAALLSEVLGDGKFTLYAVGSSSNYKFRVDKGVAVVVIDAGK